MTPIIVLKNDLQAVAGISPATAWRLERTGRFPRRRQLTQGRVGWLYSELEEWAGSTKIAR